MPGRLMSPTSVAATSCHVLSAGFSQRGIGNVRRRDQHVHSFVSGEGGADLKLLKSVWQVRISNSLATCFEDV